MEKCKICGREFKNIVALLTHVSENHKIKSKEYYDTYFKKENEGICPICGKPIIRVFLLGIQNIVLVVHLSLMK